MRWLQCVPVGIKILHVDRFKWHYGRRLQSLQRLLAVANRFWKYIAGFFFNLRHASPLACRYRFLTDQMILNMCSGRVKTMLYLHLPRLQTCFGHVGIEPRIGIYDCKEKLWDSTPDLFTNVYFTCWRLFWILTEMLGQAAPAPSMALPPPMREDKPDVFRLIRAQHFFGLRFHEMPALWPWPISTQMNLGAEFAGVLCMVGHSVSQQGRQLWEIWDSTNHVLLGIQEINADAPQGSMEAMATSTKLHNTNRFKFWYSLEWMGSVKLVKSWRLKCSDLSGENCVPAPENHWR